jgi:nitrous-oxide reductase
MKKTYLFAAIAAAALLAVGTRKLHSQTPAATPAAQSADEKPADINATMVGVEYQGVKMWLPGTIFAKKGQTVKIKIINKIPGEGTTHGFAIDAFSVKKVVAQGETTTVRFTADQDGIFPIYCQLHPAHVGGQLVVLP